MVKQEQRFDAVFMEVLWTRLISTVDEAAKVREFQDTHDLRLLFIYLRFRGRAKRYFQKYGDYFAF